MSIEHLNAAFKCKQFRGSTRLLLLALANRASDGKPRKTGKTIPRGYSFAGTAQLMMDIGALSRDTVIDSMSKLQKAKVVDRRRRLGTSSLSFVDIDALRKMAYTDADKEEFQRKSKAAVKKSDGDSGKALPPKAGKSAAAEVDPSTTTEDGNEPTLTEGNVPTDNLQSNQQEYEPKEGNPSVSESVQADTGTEKDVTANDNGESECCAGKEEKQDGALSRKENLPARPPTRGTSCPEPKQEERTTTDPKEYADAVYLCSLFWATHDPDDEPEPEEGDRTTPNSPEHPRYWTAAKRRETFLQRVHEAEADSQYEGEADDGNEEERLLADEQAMLALYLEHGREPVEQILRWLPCSNNPHVLSMKTVAALRGRWKQVSEQYERYIATAAENGSESECASYMEARFKAAGGDLAEFLCWTRLHPEDWRSAVAEERCRDAYDELHGDDFFYPWGQEDYEARLAAQQARDAGARKDDANSTVVALEDGVLFPG